MEKSSFITRKLLRKQGEQLVPDRESVAYVVETYIRRNWLRACSFVECVAHRQL